MSDKVKYVDSQEVQQSLQEEKVSKNCSICFGEARKFSEVYQSPNEKQRSEVRDTDRKKVSEKDIKIPDFLKSNKKQKPEEKYTDSQIVKEKDIKIPDFLKLERS